MILHLKVKWADAIMDGPVPCGKVVEDGPGQWVLLLRMSPSTSPLVMRLTPGGSPALGASPVWVLEKLGETVYSLNPSIISSDIGIQHAGKVHPLHGYVTLYDCPAGIAGYPEPARSPT